MPRPAPVWNRSAGLDFFFFFFGLPEKDTLIKVQMYSVCGVGVQIPSVVILDVFVEWSVPNGWKEGGGGILGTSTAATHPPYFLCCGQFDPCHLLQTFKMPGVFVPNKWVVTVLYFTRTSKTFPTGMGGVGWPGLGGLSCRLRSLAYRV